MAVHPDLISGMYYWHQHVRIERPEPDDKYGDTNKSRKIYKEWLAMTRLASRPAALSLIV